MSPITFNKPSSRFYTPEMLAAPQNWRDLDCIKICIVDTETTGLNPAQDEIIELALMTLAYQPQSGKILGYIDKYDKFNQPIRPIPEKITRITGITDHNVDGRKIDWMDVELLIADCDYVIAHNAAFDRPFINRATRVFDGMRWGCSLKDVDWDDLGFNHHSLTMLSLAHNLVFDAHRAINDVEQLACLLEITGTTHCVVRASTQSSYNIFATNAPFHLKDDLKENGYSWNATASQNRPKSWFKSGLSAEGVREEYATLEQMGVNPLVVEIPALSRFAEIDASK